MWCFQKCRLGPQGWYQMLQWDKASEEEEPLGKWVKQGYDECGGQSCEENESSCECDQHNTDLRV